MLRGPRAPPSSSFGLTAAPGFVVDLYDFDLTSFGTVGTTIAVIGWLLGAKAESRSWIERGGLIRA